jgi:hypothetical protein
MRDMPASRPLLTQPWEAGVTGWIVVFGAVLTELVCSLVTYNSPAAVAVPVLLAPAAVALGVGLVQWWQTRSSGAESASWWHLAGVAAALFAWLIWPTAPAVLAGADGSAQAACNALPTTQTAQCLTLAARALDAHNLTWWLTGTLILVAALLTRRSRIAAWAAIPIAFAGCELATYFLQALVNHYTTG